MSRLTVSLLCVCIVSTVCYAGDAPDIEAAVIRFFSSDGSSRISGKGEFIHQIYKKAVDVNDLTKGIEFENGRHRETYLRLMSKMHTLDFSMKEDTNRYFVEKYYYDNDKVRKDRAAISLDKIASIKNTGIPDDLDFAIHAFDGSKTISLETVSNQDGEAMVADIVNEKIYVPNFHLFGLNDSGKDAEIFLNAIKNGQYTLKGFNKDGLIHANLEFKPTPMMPMNLEIVLDPSKDMVALSSKLYVGNNLKSETICENYIRTDSGQWYPKVHISRQFLTISDKLIIKTYEEKFEVIGEPVDFNIPIDDKIFNPEIPYGTSVNDWRYKQPAEYVINPPDQSALDVIEDELVEKNRDSSAVQDKKITGDELLDTNEFGTRSDDQMEADGKRTTKVLIVMIVIFVGAFAGFFLRQWYINRKRLTEDRSKQ